MKKSLKLTLFFGILAATLLLGIASTSTCCNKAVVACGRCGCGGNH